MTVYPELPPTERINDIVNNAEDISNPFRNLLAEVEENPSTAFKPDVVERLKVLMDKEPRSYQLVREKLQAKDCPVETLDQLVGDDDRKPASHTDMLLQIVEGVDVFRCPDRKAYADLMINSHRETWSVKSESFAHWLKGEFFRLNRGAASPEAIQKAIDAAEAKALFDAPERPVFLRVGSLCGKLYLDLCDEAWRVVEIGATGWQLVTDQPIRFRRTNGMKPLPLPQSGGSIETLKDYLNVQGDGDFVLAVSWLLAALKDTGPYPVLVLSGEQGSAKSTFTRILRLLLDPNLAALRSLPSTERDFFIGATNSHVQAFDNLSRMASSISDTLCRLSTGGAFATRQLYSDDDEMLFEACRPIILNGIEDTVSRSDLADRSIFLTLAPIPDDRRKSERELFDAFEADRPFILGALLDAISVGLRRQNEVNLPIKPRMADFAQWASACETAFRSEGTFMHDYLGNRQLAVNEVIEADAVATGIIQLMETREVWSGTATNLLDELNLMADEKTLRLKDWPSNARALSNRLTRVAPALRKSGIDVEHRRQGKQRSRIITLTVKKNGEGPSASSAPSATLSEASNSADPGCEWGRPQNDAADARDDTAEFNVRREFLETANSTQADAADANSGPPETSHPSDQAEWKAVI